jgi:hypothetical protein
MTTPMTLRRRGFGSLLLATAGAVIVRPGFGLGATDDPPAPLRTFTVDTTKKLAKALSIAWPGDHIVLANAPPSPVTTPCRGPGRPALRS